VGSVLLIFDKQPEIFCMQCPHSCTLQLTVISLVPRPSHPSICRILPLACSTNIGEGLVKLSHIQWHTWTCWGVAHSRETASKWVYYQSQTPTVEQLSAMTSDRLGNILFAKAQHLIPELGTYLSTKAQPFVNKHQAIIYFLSKQLY